MPHPATNRIRPPKLPEIQEQIAELASDLIMNGGDRRSVDKLLEAVIRHSTLRRFSTFKDQTCREELAEQHAAEWRAGWYRRLARHWPENSPAIQKAKTVTITDLLASNVRLDVESSFQSFIRNVEGFTDLFLLRDILRDVDSGNGELGEAFAHQLAQCHTYVKVSWKYADRVREFARLLEDGDEAG